MFKQSLRLLQAKTITVGLIPGDGIGKEVIPAGVAVLNHVTKLPQFSNIKFDYVPLEAGWETFTKYGEALPDSTVKSLKENCDCALFGAVQSPTTKVAGYSSPIVKLRKEMGLYANIRPVKEVVPNAKFGKVDMCIVRENTEDLYIKKETTYTDSNGKKVADAIKRITETASENIMKISMEIASQKAATTGKKQKLTVVHKSNVLSQSDGLFRETCANVYKSSPKEQQDNVIYNEQIVDSMVYKMFRDPSEFDFVVAPNLYGDILSDGAAALVGSLGLVPSCNVGKSIFIGEPCHGSAPDIAGKGIANPIATIRSTALMLEFMGHTEMAQVINDAVDANIIEGAIKTPDLGGSNTSEEVLQDVLKRIN